MIDSVEKGPDVFGQARPLSIRETAFFTYSLVVASVALAVASHR
jgi:hypothetical protein